MSDLGLIIVSLISIAGTILITQMMQMGWFKKERFRFDQATKRKEYNINFKALEKKLGMQQSAPMTEDRGIIESIKGLDLDKVQSMLQLAQKPEDQEEIEYYDDDPKTLPEQLIQFATENPEIAQKFIGNLGIGGGGDSASTQQKIKYLGEP